MHENNQDLCSTQKAISSQDTSQIFPAISLEFVKSADCDFSCTISLPHRKCQSPVNMNLAKKFLARLVFTVD